MAYLMWWPLLDSLQKFASAHTAMTGIDVRVGSKRPKDPYPCVEIIWDQEDAQNLFRTKDGEFVVWLDCWIKNSAKDPSAGYSDLCTLQESLCQVVVEWTDAVMEDIDMLLNLELNGIVSDGDSNRPLCGSRMILNIKWKRCS